MSVVPQHGGAKQLGTGLMRKIKKDWAIDDPRTYSAAAEGFMLHYPVEFTSDDNGTVMVTLPDIPEVTTFGDDEADALANAVDALETALTAYIIDRRHIPAPSFANGRATVSPGQREVQVA